MTAASRSVLAWPAGARRLNGENWPAQRKSLQLTGAAIGAGAVLGLVAVAVATPAIRLSPLVLVLALAPFVVMMVGSLQRALLAIAIVDSLLRWDVNLFLREDLGGQGALAGLDVSATTVAIAGLYALWIGESLAGRGDPASPKLRAAVPAIAFVAINALSLVVARNATLASFELILLVQAALIYLYIASNIRRRADVVFMVRMLLVALLVQGVIGVVIWTTGSEFSVLGLTGGFENGRLAGTVGSPVVAGSVIAFLIAPALAVLATSLDRPTKALAGLAALVGTISLVATGSRGAWFALALSVGLLVVLGWRLGWMSPRSVTAIVGVVLVVGVALAGPISERITSDDRGSAAARLPLMRLAAEIIEDKPALGVGVNNFSVVIPEYAGPEFSRAFLFSAHNKYLLVWAEAGVVALLAFIVFLVLTLRRGWLTARAGDPLLSPLALGLAVAIGGQMVHMTVDVFNSRPQVQLLWLAAGLVAALHFRTRGARASQALVKTEPVS